MFALKFFINENLLESLGEVEDQGYSLLFQLLNRI